MSPRWNAGSYGSTTQNTAEMAALIAGPSRLAMLGDGTVMTGDRRTGEVVKHEWNDRVAMCRQFLNHAPQFAIR